MKKITKNLLLGLGGISLLGGVVGTTISCSKTEEIPRHFIEKNINFVNDGVDGGWLVTGFEDELNTASEITIEEEYYGKKVTQIYYKAFEKKRLSNIKLPNSIKIIEEYAFKENNIISPLNLPTSLETIETAAFENNKITSLVIPSSVKTIGELAFDTNQIENLIIKSGVTSIGRIAFAGNKIKNLIVPDSVTEIGNSAFNNNHLVNVRVPDKFRATIEEWERIGFPRNLYPGPATTSNNEEEVISLLREENYAANDSKPNAAK